MVVLLVEILTAPLQVYDISEGFRGARPRIRSGGVKWLMRGLQNRESKNVQAICFPKQGLQPKELLLSGDSHVLACQAGGSSKASQFPSKVTEFSSPKATNPFRDTPLLWQVCRMCFIG